MADNTRIDNLFIRYTVDKASVDNAIKTSNRVRDSIAAQVDSLKKTEVVSKSATKQMADMTQALDRNQKGVRISKERYDELAKSIDKVAGSQDNLNDKQNRLRSLDTVTTATQRALGGIGVGGQVGAAVGGIGDIAQLASDLPALKTAFQSIPAAVKDATSAIGASGVGLIGGVLVLTLALSLAQKQFEATSKAAQAELEGRTKALDLIREGTTEQLQAQRDVLLAQKANDQARADNANKLLSDFRQAIASDPTTKFFSGLIEVGAQLGIGAGQLSAVEKDADKYNAALGNTATELALLEQKLATGGNAANDLKAAREELTKAEEDEAKALEQLAQQRNAILKNEGQQVAQLTEDRIVQDLRELEDYNAQRAEQLEKHNETLLKIDEDGQKRLESIRASGLDRIAKIDGTIADLNKNLAKIDDDGASKREEVNREYMRDELVELEKFRKDEARRTHDYYKERARLLEDLNDTLLAAEQENDVNAFIAAQQAAEKELRRNQEDFDEATQQRQEDFLQERQLEQQRLAERLADINTEAEQRRLDTQERIAEQQAAKAQVLQDIADQMAAERARILQSKIDQQAAFDEQQRKEQEQFDKRQKREAEDEARADLRRANALAAQLADIAKKEEVERLAVDAIIMKMNQLRIAAGGFSIGNPGSPSAGTSNGTNSSYYNTGGSSSGGPFAFAQGGVVTRPTRALMGEKPGWGDLVLPFRKSDGPQGALKGAGGDSVIINLNAPIGNGVTRAEVTAELTKMGQTIVAAKWKARTGASAA